MDPHALAVLEFPVIVERLVAATETEPGAELARRLLPSADSDEVARRRNTMASKLTPPIEEKHRWDGRLFPVL